MRIKLAVTLFLLSIVLSVPAQQITIPRIEQMPNLPSPYIMRNWKDVARGYDSLVFNFNLSGNYFPLGWINTNTTNYPLHNSFGLDSYVGTKRYHLSEAINVLPAVIGASLVGIDKRNQDGNNWTLYCEEYFNKKNAENIYLNSPSAASGDDWWYSTMPNVFFYQLYDLYRGTGDFNNQFETVADRWLLSVQSMGGSAAPWQTPNMDYRGWYLASMTPNTQGVHEPEAAGAIAWLLYNAYLETGNKKYRAGAEWSLEFLNNYYSNPSYELQLPYGVYTAARMNAEIGTVYDIEKLFNWCFDVGALRSWGAITGNWNGYDVSGLIGEVSSNDYAFLMNSIEQAGALVPLVRYDERFARAVGKWVLNMANAARLFYPNYLPDVKQDSRDWSSKYDSNSYIAHEALRKEGLANNSPYATGDAISGGWANTNLSLYSSSHVGVLGGIIDTTNVEKILKLDLLKTDYFHKSAYPSYLIYNPYNAVKTVEINCGSGSYDLYNTVTKSYLLRNASGKVNISVAADNAVVVVILPANGSVTYDLNKMLVNGIIIDYNYNKNISNYPPRIKSLSAVKNTMTLNDSVDIYCTATDKNNNNLTYLWSTNGGTINAEGDKAGWIAPSAAGSYKVICRVTDGNGGEAADTVTINVTDKPHSIPQIKNIKAVPGKLNLGASAEITCDAVDTSGSALIYVWSSASGTILGSGNKITWKAPFVKGNYFISCTVMNNSYEMKTDSIEIPVRDLSVINKGNLVLYLPFNGNANDESGNNNNGSVYGAVLTADRNGNSSSAYYFNGADSYILVPNSQQLNFRDTISINFWLNIGEFYQREEYPISHGNWENRWKISVTNNKIRWTIKTDKGTKDLDSKTTLELNKFYNITAYYDGSDMELYINGELDSFTSFTGLINTTTYDLTIGQVLPANKNYNFKGIIDDIRIYNYALSLNEITALFKGITGVNDIGANVPTADVLLQNYPNPFNPSTRINYSLSNASYIKIKIFDLLGREIVTLEEGRKSRGSYSVLFEPEKYKLASGVYICKMQTEKTSAAKKIIYIR